MILQRSNPAPITNSGSSIGDSLSPLALHGVVPGTHGPKLLIVHAVLLFLKVELHIDATDFLLECLHAVVIVLLVVKVDQPAFIASVLSEGTLLKMRFHFVAQDPIRSNFILFRIVIFFLYFLAIERTAISLPRTRIEVSNCFIVRHLLLVSALLIGALELKPLQVLLSKPL